MAWISLLITLLSGVAWLVLTAESMSGQPLGRSRFARRAGTVLTQTEFGNDWLLRFAVACLLGGLFVHFLSAKGVDLAMAENGHGVSGRRACRHSGLRRPRDRRPRHRGIVHPAADVLHLIAAAAWVGALVPLALLLTMTGRTRPALAVTRTATLRFSTLGIVSVATLLLTGIVNSWYLVGSVSALTGND